MPSLRKIKNLVVKDTFLIVYGDARIVKHCRPQARMDANNSVSIQSQVCALQESKQHSGAMAVAMITIKESWK